MKDEITEPNEVRLGVMGKARKLMCESCVKTLCQGSDDLALKLMTTTSSSGDRPFELDAYSNGQDILLSARLLPNLLDNDVAIINKERLRERVLEAMRVIANHGVASD